MVYPKTMASESDTLSIPDQFVTAAFNAALPGVSPGGLIEALDDPKVIEKMSRGDLYLQLGLMRKFAQANNFTIDQRIRYITLLAKLAGMFNPEPAPLGASQLPQINISIPQYATGYTPTLPERFLKPKAPASVLEHNPDG